MAMFIILTLANCPLKQWGICCPTHREVQDGGNHFDEGGRFGGGSTDQLRDHTFTSSLTDRQTIQSQYSTDTQTHWPTEGSYIYQQPDRQTNIHYKVITVESSLFVGVYVCGFCGMFTSPITFNKVMNCLSMQQISYPQNYVPTNQQSFNNPRTLAE